MLSKRMRLARPWLLLCGLGLLGQARAQALELPVRRTGGDVVAAPAYLGDRVEIRLRPQAAAAVRRARPAPQGESAHPALARVGVASLDRLAAALGGARFEPEFLGETPPPAGSDEPDFTAFYRVLLPPGAGLEEALAGFRALAEVESADPIAVLPVSAIPNDSLWSTSTWFYQPSRRDLHAPEAWDVTRGDSAIVVAVLDTGVLPYHPDLGGTVAGSRGQLWTNWAEQGGVPGVDDDGNGYVDDDAGWDFVSFPSSFGITPGEDWRDADNDPNDFVGHGTEMAGVVGALTDNTIGVAGTAWEVRLMPLRIGWSSLASPGGEVDMSFVAAAIRYATLMGASVINCSFATLNLSGLYTAAAAAVRGGVTIVNAAGNSGQPHELANRDDVIAVAATDAGDQVAGFSNTGSFVDLAAPGDLIASTALVHDAGDSVAMRRSAYDDAISGTSPSTAFVSGAAALLQALRRAQALPPLHPMSVLLRLRETADDIAALNPSVTGYGTGRLDLLRALTDPPTSFARRGNSLTVGPAVLLPTISGRTRVAFASFDQRLVMLDGATGDTLWSVALPGRPAKQVAAADLGGGLGVGLFVGTTNGKLAGYDPQGAPLAGFPVTGPASIYPLSAGPALGDLDGDGVLEVVCGADDGSVWAWHADGNPLPDFPVSSGSLALGGPVALSPMTGTGDAQIIAANRDGSVHVFLADGSDAPGWPVTLGSVSAAPVVAVRPGWPDPMVLVPAAGVLNALYADGTTRFAVSPGGSLNQDPALGDFDGDSFDEIVLATSSPSRVAVLDTNGVMRSDRGFPRVLSSAPQGPPLVGHIQTRTTPGILVFAGNTQVAVSDSAALIASFPKPGGAGATPTLAELDGDGRTEAVAGTGPDLVLYVYDAGPGTWHGGSQPWGTPRGNFARTGSRLYAPALPAIDDVAPAPIADLAADSVAAGVVRLAWTAPGDDSTAGAATA